MLNKPHKILDLPNELKHGKTASESWSLRAVKVVSFFGVFMPFFRKQHASKKNMH